ncbi:hypothetical protein OF83DRAFT_1177451 [Amylostereum chailletii]|nr:hypothetical protein OF83DRAFT_1177451 [Amylostereum chailletii]
MDPFDIPSSPILSASSPADDEPDEPPHLDGNSTDEVTMSRRFSPVDPTPSPSPPRQISGQHSLSSTPLKRTRDTSQCALAVGRQLKLKKGDQDALNVFAKVRIFHLFLLAPQFCSVINLSFPHNHFQLEIPEQLTWLSARALKHEAQLSMLQPPDAMFVMSKALEAKPVKQSKIDHFAFVTVLSPDLSAYTLNNIPHKIILDLIDRHPEWGMPPEVKTVKHQYDIVVKHVNTKLTEHRYDLKKVILSTLPTTNGASALASLSNTQRPKSTDVVDVCRALVSKGRKTTLEISVPMLVRVAFLRDTLVRNPSTNTFWEIVDRHLADLHEQFKDNPPGLSRHFGKVLELDHKMYGSLTEADINAFSGVHTSDDQIEVDAAATAAVSPASVIESGETEPESS